MSRIEGSKILITGGASGIGKLMAQRFADRGATVVIWDVDDPGMERLAVEMESAGRRIGVYHCDVSNRAEVLRVAESVNKDFGGIDILINNAGIVTGQSFLDATDEQIEKGMAVNALAHFWTVRAFLPGMIRAGRGHIVTISSAAGLIGVSRLVDYCAAKFAVFGFDEALRIEIKQKKWKIRTTVVCPYFIDTGMFDGARTRFSSLLPILDRQRVADRIVKAVEGDRRRLLMPPMVYLIWLLRYLPTSAFDFTANLLGINATMEGFKGRAGESALMRKK